MIEANFKDRIPTYPGRITLDPVEGAVNTYTMARADEPTEPGTALDKATLESITKSRLTGRFYPLTVTRAVSSARVETVSPLSQTGWIVATDGLSATNGSYKISVNSIVATDYTPEKALDGDEETSWGSSEGTAMWYEIKLPVAIKISKIKISLGWTQSTYTFTTRIQGSTNGSSWVDLYTLPSNPSTLTEFTLTNSGDYQYYRIYIERGGNSRAYIQEFEISEYTLSTYANAFTADGMPGTWTAGQRVTVQTPVMPLLSVVSNTFNGIKCNTLLQSNRKYELRYNGSTFDAKEV